MQVIGEILQWQNPGFEIHIGMLRLIEQLLELNPVFFDDCRYRGFNMLRAYRAEFGQVCRFKEWIDMRCLFRC
jgi:hypothetical protein